MNARVTLLVLALAASAGFSQTKSRQISTFDGFRLVDQSGNIRKPQDYRDRYEALGAWTVLDPKGNEMHYTYASPGTAQYYRAHGKCPDGAVLVKEIFATDHAQLTTAIRQMGLGGVSGRVRIVPPR
jgi:Cytochrome P460